VLTPEKSYEFYSDLVQSLSVPVSVHCHNDFGMAVANSVSALRAGCSEVHCTINGLGERAGNASLEEIVVALKSLYNIDVGLKTELLYSTSQLVSRLSGIIVQPNKAIVGENAFTHESGIHTQGLLENPETYESIDPSMVGVARRISPENTAAPTPSKPPLKPWAYTRQMTVEGNLAASKNCWRQRKKQFQTRICWQSPRQ
jgi:D-citramalate synthase